MSQALLVVVMGVSGVGKSTLAEAISVQCHGEYLDADAFHPPENVRKMKSGTPLNDEDRVAWLDHLNAALRARSNQSTPVILACSALKESYRARLSAGGLRLDFIHLTAPKELIRQRMEGRKDHYMPPTLLDSQFAALEPPTDALTLDSRKPLAELIEAVAKTYPRLAQD